jgi:tripartite-type tricarboxylate transporter receptor subunit TctC
VQDLPEVQKQFDLQGAAVQKMSSAEFGKFVDSEMSRWERVVKEAGIKAE